MVIPTLDALGQGKYLSLTTFKKDGTAVATPVWLVREGNSLRVITQGDSGKAKRLRNNPAVLVAACDARGRLRSDQVPGTATLLEVEETDRTVALITARYGMLGRMLMWRHERRGGGIGAVGLSITLD